MFVVVEVDFIYLRPRHRAHASAAVLQQPGTEQAGTTHSALSSTASVMSTNAFNAAAKCGSEISYRVCRPWGSATTIPQSRRQVRWFDTFERVSPSCRDSTAG